jgi:hypothetical protein
VFVGYAHSSGVPELQAFPEKLSTFVEVLFAFHIVKLVENSSKAQSYRLYIFLLNIFIAFK